MIGYGLASALTIIASESADLLSAGVHERRLLPSLGALAHAVPSLDPGPAAFGLACVALYFGLRAVRSSRSRGADHGGGSVRGGRGLSPPAPWHRDGRAGAGGPVQARAPRPHARRAEAAAHPRARDRDRGLPRLEHPRPVAGERSRRAGRPEHRGVCARGDEPRGRHLGRLSRGRVDPRQPPLRKSGRPLAARAAVHDRDRRLAARARERRSEPAARGAERRRDRRRRGPGELAAQRRRCGASSARSSRSPWSRSPAPPPSG